MVVYIQLFIAAYSPHHKTVVSTFYCEYGILRKDHINARKAQNDHESVESVET